MNAVTGGDGRTRFTLGPVERWVVAIGALVVTSLLGYMGTATLQKLDRVNDTANDLKTQQAVTNNRLDTMSAQLIGISNLPQQIAVLQDKVDNNTARLNRLEASKTGGGK